jgi:hypothetical protein
MEPLDDGRARRRIPASVAKRNAIEVVRDLAVEDGTFAKMVTPVLEEFAGSIAKGEWQSCLAAAAWIRRAQPAAFGIVPPVAPRRDSKRTLGRRKAAAARAATKPAGAR